MSSRSLKSFATYGVVRHRKNLVRKYMLDNEAQVITFGDAGNITYRTQLRFNIKL